MKLFAFQKVWESNAIELLAMIRETTPGKYFALYIADCSGSG